MIKLDFYTRLGKNEIDSSFGRPKIYISYQKDGLSFIESLISQILSITDAVIYYINYEESNNLNKEEIKTYLEEMNVIIIAVDDNYLDKNKANFSYDVEKEALFNNNTPIIPILKRHKDMEKYREYYHEVQCLIVDEILKINEKPFINKLEEHLHRFISKDIFYQKASQAFERIVFLSYRKVDKTLAKQLMDDIYQDTSCSHIGVWYDDFLIAGENFEKTLKRKINDSDLFMMLITPNMVIPGNYVQTDEYPFATSHSIDVLPVEIQKTDRESLETIYQGIPSCINKKDVNSLLLSRYESKKANDEIIFERGVAFFNGINVITNKELGLKLIKNASDNQNIEAMLYLANLYLNGNFVSKNYDKAEELYQGVIDLLKPHIIKDSWDDIYILYFKLKTSLSDIVLMANKGKEEAKKLTLNIIDELENINVPKDKESRYVYYHFLYDAYKRAWGYDSANNEALNKSIEIANILMELNPEEAKDNYLETMFSASLSLVKSGSLDIEKLIDIKEEYKKLVSKDVNKYLYRYTQLLTMIAGFSKGDKDLILDLKEALDLINKVGDSRYRDMKISAQYFLIREQYRYGDIAAKETEEEILNFIKEYSDDINDKFTLLNIYLLLSEVADEARDNDVDLFALKMANDVNEELRQEFGDELADGIEISIKVKEALRLIRNKKFKKAKELVLPLENKSDVIADKINIYHILALAYHDDIEKAKYYFSLFKKYQKIFIDNTPYTICHTEINTYLQTCVTFLRSISSDDVTLIKEEYEYIINVISKFKRDDSFAELEEINNVLFSVFNEDIGEGQIPHVYSFIIKEFVKGMVEISKFVKDDIYLAYQYLYSAINSKFKYASFLDNDSDYELEKNNREVILSQIPHLKDNEDFTLYFIYLAVNTLRLGRVASEEERLRLYKEYLDILEEKQNGTDMIANISISVYFVALGYLDINEYEREIVDKLEGDLYSFNLLHYLCPEEDKYGLDVLDKHLRIYTALFNDPIRLTSDHAQLALHLLDKDKIKLLYSYSLGALDSCCSVIESDTVDDPVNTNAIYYFYRVSIITGQSYRPNYIKTLIEECEPYKRDVLDLKTITDYPYLHPDAGQILAKLLFKKYIEEQDIEALNEVAYTAFALFNYAKDQEDGIKSDVTELACNIFTKYQVEAYEHQDQYELLIDYTISFLAILDSLIRDEINIPVLEQSCLIVSLLDEVFFKIKNYQAVSQFSLRMLDYIAKLDEDFEHFDTILAIKMYSDLAHSSYYQGQNNVALSILKNGLVFIKSVRNVKNATPILSYLDLLLELSENEEEKEELSHLFVYHSPDARIDQKIFAIQRLILAEYKEGYDSQALYYAEEGIRIINSLETLKRKEFISQLKDFYKSAILISKGLGNEDLAYHYTLLLRKID